MGNVQLKHPNYYQQGEFHVCQFCGEPIRNSANGKFSLNASFGQAAYHMHDPNSGKHTNYVITGCKSCLSKIKHKDHELLQAVYDNDPATQEGFVVEEPSNYRTI